MEKYSKTLTAYSIDGHLQTDSQVLTVGQAVAVVAIHSMTLQNTGPFTACEDFGAGHSHQQQKHQSSHIGLSSPPNVSPVAGKRPYILSKALSLLFSLVISFEFAPVSTKLFQHRRFVLEHKTIETG